MKKAIDQTQDSEINVILKKLEDIELTLKPIAETYHTVSSLGKWSMAIMVFISVVLGILIGIKNLLK